MNNMESFKNEYVELSKRVGELSKELFECITKVIEMQDVDCMSEEERAEMFEFSKSNETIVESEKALQELINLF